MSLGFLKKPSSSSTPQPTPAEIKTEIRVALAQTIEDDKLLIQPDAEVMPNLEIVLADDEHTGRLSGSNKLSKLIDADFPFDESQLEAVEGMIESTHACLIGAAGTGKTTVTKKFVDRLLETTTLGGVDLRKYWKSDFDSADEMQDFEHYDSEDDYEVTESVVPSVILCSFTGRASQQIKGNFPRDWHGNIMTIHRMLGFYPEPYEDWDPEYIDEETGARGRMITKRRFVPTYTADFKMPWDVIGIDEAGMLGVDLWHQLLAACKPGTRIYMIGDINQLQPVHGKSILGFALAKWPVFELTHVHRQQGVDNPIVDNAWRVIHGQMPISGGRFQMIKVDGDAQLVSRKVRAMMPKLQEMGIYEPIRDTIITPINGEDGSRGYALGQLPLNREFALIFNPSNENPRYLIDGGRVKQRFAVGDKVMATKNDWEAGITNGMTGIITGILENGAYMGDRDKYGSIQEISERLKNENAGVFEETELLDLDKLSESVLVGEAGKRAAKEKRERGPSSHIVTVRFGTGEHAFEIPFATLAEVGTLMTAYVVTCHKMQGGEAPTIVIIVHDSHKAMLYREWLYTAITRASEKCILIYTESALRIALNKQSIKGRTLKEKVASFNSLLSGGDSFDALARTIKLPEVESRGLTIMDREDTQVATPARMTTEAERSGGLASLVKKAHDRVEIRETTHVHVHIHHTRDSSVLDRVVDGGSIEAESVSHDTRIPDAIEPPAPRLAGPAEVRLVPMRGAARIHVLLSGLRDSPRALSYHPAEPKAEPFGVPKPQAPAESPRSITSGMSFLLKRKEPSA